MDYTREAAAYKRLAAVGKTGTSAPQFYGSWIFKLPITSRGAQHKRSVRVVLLERLEGLDLRRSYHAEYKGQDASHLPEEYRLEVLAQIMDIHVGFLRWGVDHGDIADRNVMLVAGTSPTLSTGHDRTVLVPCMVLIDYNVSTVYSCTRMGKHQFEGLARLVNPLELFWNWSLCSDFETWAPREWQGSERLPQEWLLRRFGSEEQRGLYEPVTRELEFSKY